VVKLFWDDRSQRLLDSINRRLNSDWRRSLLLARAFLDILREEGHQPTLVEVITRVYNIDRPVGGWEEFKREEWLDLAKRVQNTLALPEPLYALQRMS